VNRVAFRIQGMDCAEEVAILKRELVPLLAGDAGRLQFDLIGQKLTLNLSGNVASREDVQRAIARTGMTATLWDEQAVPSALSAPEALWRRRELACAASGLFIALGFLSHVWRDGWLAALSLVDLEKEFPRVSAGLYLIAAALGMWFVVPKAVSAVRRLRPDMNLLMTVAVIGAMAIGEWFEAASVTFLFALALLLESWSAARARRAIESLMEYAPATARVIGADGLRQDLPVEEVSVGAVVTVHPGDRIPLDGVLTKGSTTVNQSPITGESAPVAKGPGQEVFAGTFNNEGSFEFRVTRAAGDTTLARIIRMVEEAGHRRAARERWVDAFAAYYTPAMLLFAVCIAVVPPLFLGAEWGRWFYQALVVLVIACPCALVISTPVSIVAGLTAAARHGVLIKGGLYLEASAELRAVALDKTGTLTQGRPEVQRIMAFEGHSETELFERAAALEALSEHPIAQAILRKAHERGLTHTRAETYVAIKGKGAEGLVNGRLYWIGNHRFVHERDMEHVELLDPQVAALEDAGHSVVFIGSEQHVCGLVTVADSVRAHAPEAIADLRKSGIDRAVMLTGDNEGTARAVAEATGVDAYHAELLPEDKVAVVHNLVREFGSVAMVGDGVNDAPAMAAATVGIAMGAAGSDAAIETADIALMADDLRKLAWLIRHSKRTLAIIRQNTFFALGIKVVFLMLALLGVATLWMAILADMGASLAVISNSLRLLGNSRPMSAKRREMSPSPAAGGASLST